MAKAPLGARRYRTHRRSRGEMKDSRVGSHKDARARRSLKVNASRVTVHHLDEWKTQSGVEWKEKTRAFELSLVIRCAAGV